MQELNKPGITRAQISALTEKQLLMVEKHIADNMRAVDKQIKDLPSANEPALSQVTEELRTLLTRTAALSMAVASNAASARIFKKFAKSFWSLDGGVSVGQQLRTMLQKPGWR